MTLVSEYGQICSQCDSGVVIYDHKMLYNIDHWCKEARVMQICGNVVEKFEKIQVFAEMRTTVFSQQIVTSLNEVWHT